MSRLFLDIGPTTTMVVTVLVCLGCAQSTAGRDDWAARYRSWGMEHASDFAELWAQASNPAPTASAEQRELADSQLDTLIVMILMGLDDPESISLGCRFIADVNRRSTYLGAIREGIDKGVSSWSGSATHEHPQSSSSGAKHIEKVLAQVGEQRVLIEEARAMLVDPSAVPWPERALIGRLVFSVLQLGGPEDRSTVLEFARRQSTARHDSEWEAKFWKDLWQSAQLAAQRIKEGREPNDV